MTLDEVGFPGQIPELTPVFRREFADDRLPEREDQRTAFLMRRQPSMWHRCKLSKMRMRS